MQAKEIRERFCEFFIKNGHKKVGSSPLIPIDDPTLLFANAGMNQFKDFFTGTRKPDYPTAVTVQKCVRAGGKHNDLENVGFTARHQTFFEMLGNFSFGDYFKEQAIELAWKFLTQELKIPKEKLWITVFEDDDEAEKIWIEQQNIPKDRIYRMGKKDNFWEMGEYGPCGPCSEIFYDHGETFATGATDPNNPITDEGRFVEIWNLVFMQFEKSPEGTKQLPNPCVDTGAGLERLAAVLQGVYWNYDTDLFSSIIEKLSSLSGKEYAQGKKHTGSLRVIADHIRAATMLITDGVMPASDGRGYVLRRIIRRAIRHLQELGIKQTALYTLVPQVFEILGNSYPENKSNQTLAETVLKQEEEKFRQTLDQGLKVLNQALKEENPNKILPGDIAFKLYDTFGFPLDLTETICEERNWKVDTKGFKKFMQEQIERSKQSGKFSAQEDQLKPFYRIFEENGLTEFLGYQQLSTQSTLLGALPIGEHTGLVFKQTPFYGESGGQSGDTGSITSLDKKITLSIIDTIKPNEGQTIHITKSAELSDFIGKEFQLIVDEQNRQQTTYNHSATHLLQSALINILGDHVKQAGSLVTSDKLRFDFTHPKKLTPEEIRQVNNQVNQAISNAYATDIAFMSKDQAMEKGAMALFGEKYGEQVRVITMGDYSIELCGGTHVANTSEIGLFKIVSESSLATGIRRIEAVSGQGAFEYFDQRSSILDSIEQLVSKKEHAAIEAIEKLKKELKEKNKTIDGLQEKIQLSEIKNIFNHSVPVSSEKLYIVENGVDKKSMKKTADYFTNQFPNDHLLIVIEEAEKLQFLVKRSASSKTNLKQFSQELFKKIQGRGGGKEQMIQGSAESKDKAKFIQEVTTLFS
jgi:alanyl-tRNA synthetase